jgi:hypothetical protein
MSVKALVGIDRPIQGRRLAKDGVPLATLSATTRRSR